MGYTVMKFGGTSVADASNWRRIAKLVGTTNATGRHPVLVCSAVAGVTDALEGLVVSEGSATRSRELLARVDWLHQRVGDQASVDAGAILRPEREALRTLVAVREAERGPAWRARVMAMGELMSTRILAHWLDSIGHRCRWLDAREVLRSRAPATDSSPASYLSAECEYAASPEIQRRLATTDFEVTVTQGFIASSPNGETVLLGRGGSDTSASYLASLLEAERLEIWTDVPGLFTSDPRHVKKARLVPHLTYDEATVLGSLGAKVLHPRCLGPVKAAGIPLHIRWTQRPEVSGTVITNAAAQDGVRAVTARKDLVLVVMRRPRQWQPVGFMASVAACFERHRISMDLVSSSTAEIRATIDLSANPSAEERLPELLRDLRDECEPEISRGVMGVSIVGTGITSVLVQISGCLGLFASESIHLVSHAADDSHISVVLDQDVGWSLVTSVHDALFSDKNRAHALGARWSALQRSERITTGTPPSRPMAVNG